MNNRLLYDLSSGKKTISFNMLEHWSHLLIGYLEKDKYMSRFACVLSNARG